MFSLHIPALLFKGGMRLKFEKSSYGVDRFLVWQEFAERARYSNKAALKMRKQGTLFKNTHYTT